MSICIRSWEKGARSPDWNGWGYTVDDAVVKFCRDMFGKRYKKYWVYPVYIDDTYMRFTDLFFKEVGVELLPKLTKLPKMPKPPKGRRPYNKRRELVWPKCPNLAEWDRWYDAIDAYREEVWRIVWGDYDKNIRKGVKPKKVVLKGLQTPKGFQKLLSMEEVKVLPHTEDDLN